MTTAIIDYESGNLRSAEKSFARMALETGSGPVVVTADPEIVRRADRIVLPGVGAFAACRAGLDRATGMVEVLNERVRQDGVPFLGICVGQQLMTSVGREHGADCPGLGWIPGECVQISPSDPRMKIPHMGWNALQIRTRHPLMTDIEPGAHFYFVHSYHVVTADPDHVLATADHAGPITAMIGSANMVGTQFHPEKSQRTGLKLIANFLTWTP